MKGNKLKKIIGMAIIVIVLVLILCAVGVSIINKSKNKTTFFFGYSLLWVETGSMEPTIPEKSYILVKKYNGELLTVGDVITFVCREKDSKVYGKLITHRIESVTESGYRTKGDSELSNLDVWTVNNDDIIAVYARNLPVLTFFGRVFSSYIGLALIVVVFLVSCIFIYIPDMINALKDEDKIKAEKEKEIARRVLEEVRKMQEKDKEENKKNEKGS